MAKNNLLAPPTPQKPGEILRWSSLYGASTGLAIAQAAQTQKRPIFVITDSSRTAMGLEKEIQFFQTSSLPIRQFPDWETLPYDHFSPHHDILSQRIATLFKLAHEPQGITITPIKTLLQRISPRNFIDANTFLMSTGDLFDPHHIREQLTKCGYCTVKQVIAHGEFCLRGSVFDLFPMGSALPYRIELLDNEIESIRTFNPDTQRTIEKISEIRLLPAREFPVDEKGIAAFRQHWRDQFTGDPTQCPIYQNISHGICSAGIEYYLSLFFDETASLLDYLPSNALIILVGAIHEEANVFWQEIKERFEQLNIDRTRPLLPPDKVFFSVSDLFHQLKSFSQIKTQEESTTDKTHTIHFNCTFSPLLPINHKQENPIQLLEDFCSESPCRILICAESIGRREALIELFSKYHFKATIFPDWHSFVSGHAKVGVTICTIEQGFILTDPDIALISETQLVGQQVMQRRRRQQAVVDVEHQLRNLAELNIGSPVVHIQYGIGRYLGLQTLRSGDFDTEYLSLEYAGGDKLYVPISQLHLISRYSGFDIEHAPLHQLGSKKWQKAREKAAEQIRDVAAELLEIYARRAAQKRPAFDFDEHQYDMFSQSFPFEETPDQHTAIMSVIENMRSENPMDRLICGDVGFGKTEVAMRAAFISVNNKKQVAVLVPTTLLAQQHYQTFCDRFAEWAIHIEVISRFKTTKEQNIILDKIKNGKIDILIGTHKLLQDNIKFNSLGLVIIDEEHRFGVHQKEKFKKMRATIDILTLTATPIPRTLNMALASIRDLSIIATPPRHRLSIKTFVHERSDSLIREAVMREILRGGQVFFLHNNVETIERIASELQKSIPEARIGIGHGQMRERQLETIMSNFYHQRFNVLICTTIIETGIDIPTANTIIIDRADKFGLAQLHQLRGRVGRSHHQAYAYLLVPPEKQISADAVKRLEAISSLEDLGAGFTLASHDLEIRGAGELLGDEQSGNIHEIGLSLYTELLDRAVNAFKNGQDLDLNASEPTVTIIELNIPALIPENYLPDVHTRLVFYKRIASTQNDDDLIELQSEMIDRFGLLPEQTRNLFQLTRVRQRAEKLGIAKIEATPVSGKIEFFHHTKVDPKIIIDLLQAPNQRYKMDGAHCLRFKFDKNLNKNQLLQVEEMLDQLGGTII